MWKRKTATLPAALCFAELREFLGPRLFDRLTEQGSVLLECDWASWRQRA